MQKNPVAFAYWRNTKMILHLSHYCTCMVMEQSGHAHPHDWLTLAANKGRRRIKIKSLRVCLTAETIHFWRKANKLTAYARILYRAKAKDTVLMYILQKNLYQTIKFIPNNFRVNAIVIQAYKCASLLYTLHVHGDITQKNIAPGNFVLKWIYYI
jgi:uncharacterized protein YlbG (UPF0298 family)